VHKIWKALPFLSLISLIGAAHAQTQGVGIVSGIRGDATVRHERAAQTQALKFKDDVFWQDTLTTGADAQLRLLIMQKSVVTMKELTQLQLREDVIGGDQTKKKSVVDLTSGAVRVVVDKDMVKSGGGYEVRTNMAVAAIRGSDLYGTADKDKTEFCAGPGSSVTAIHQNPAVGTKELNNLQCASISPDRMDIRTISLNDYRLLTEIGPRGSQNNDHGGKAEGKISPPPGGGPPPGGPNNPYNNNNGCLLCGPNSGKLPKPN
jgi:FecR protein